MLIAALALLSQSATLSADPYAAAIDCAFSAGNAKQPGDSPMEGAALVSYFLMQAAKALPGDAILFEKMMQVQRRNATRPAVPVERARELMPQCDARFPLARGTRPVTLPSDPFERDTICYFMLAMMAGASEGEQERTGDSSASALYEPPMRIYQQRVDKARPARGYPTERAIAPLASTLLTRSLDQGNAASYSRACIAALPD